LKNEDFLFEVPALEQLIHVFSALPSSLAAFKAGSVVMEIVAPGPKFPD
jgi:hypothetical protein